MPLCYGANAARHTCGHSRDQCRENAALLAVELLGLTNPVWCHKLEAYRREQAKGVLDKNTKLQELGYHDYLTRAKGWQVRV